MGIYLLFWSPLSDFREELTTEAYHWLINIHSVAWEQQQVWLDLIVCLWGLWLVWWYKYFYFWMWSITCWTSWIPYFWICRLIFFQPTLDSKLVLKQLSLTRFAVCVCFPWLILPLGGQRGAAEHPWTSRQLVTSFRGLVSRSGVKPWTKNAPLLSPVS